MTTNNTFERSMSVDGQNHPTSTTSLFSLELPTQAPSTPAGQSPHLYQGRTQQPAYVPSSDVESMKASMTGTINSTTMQARPSIKRKPVPRPDNNRLNDDIPRATSLMPPERGRVWTTFDQAHLGSMLSSDVPPPAPTRPDFPGNVSSEEQHEISKLLEVFVPPPAPTRPDFPGDMFVERGVFEKHQLENREQSKAAKAAGNEPSHKTKDPYHRTIHDEYPHVFKAKPKQKPPPSKPKLSRNPSSRTFETASSFLKDVWKTAKGFTAHRLRSNGRKSGLGMSIPVTGSFHNFHPQAPRPDVLHPDIKAIPIREAQQKFARQPESGATSEEPVRPRKVKVVGDPDRGTVFEDFINPNIFDSSSEENVEASSPRLPPRRHDNTRGDSKPLSPLPPEASLPTPKATAPPFRRPNRMPGSLRGHIPNRNSAQVPTPRDSAVSGIPPVKPAPPGRERLLAHQSQPDKRVDTSVYNWVPKRDCQKGGIYDKIRSGVDYTEVDNADPDLDSVASFGMRLVPQRRPAPLPPPLHEHPAPRQPTLDFNPSSPVRWDDIHHGEFPNNRRVPYSPRLHLHVEMPRFDVESPTSDELFEDVTEAEVSRARRDNYLAGVASSQHAHQSLAVVEQLFDKIDQVVANSGEIPEDEKQWANEEIHRIDRLVRQERRVSDGSIILDTFPHDAHTSWRATEWSDDRTIHSDRRRFTREVHLSGGGHDAAGLLMEKLSGQMKGSSLRQMGGL